MDSSIIGLIEYGLVRTDKIWGTILPSPVRVPKKVGWQSIWKSEVMFLGLMPIIPTSKVSHGIATACLIIGI
jgi:hypothetical protein